MASQQQKPITRELLKEWCQAYAAIELSTQFNLLFNELKTMSETLPDSANLSQKLRLVVPNKLDENLWRCREQCEEIQLLCESQKLKELAAIDVETIRSNIDETFKRILALQEKHINHTRELVKKFLPNDFRGNMVLSYQKNSEKRAEEEIRHLTDRGGTIAEKYNLLWQMQLNRRQALVNLGQATGIYRAVVMYLGGVPQILLDFLKTINDDNGPLEEIRIKYAPAQYKLTEFLNCLRITLAILEMSNNRDIIKQSLAFAADASSCFKHEQERSVVLFEQLFIESPMIVEAEQSSAQPNGTATVVIRARSVFELPIHIGKEEVGCVIVWEFLTGSRDIGFRLEYSPFLLINNSAAKDVQEDQNRPRTNSADNHQSNCREIIVSPRRYNSSTTTRGEMKAFKQGTYFICWDNSFSVMTSKTISYKVKLVNRPGSLPIAFKSSGLMKRSSTS